MAQLMIRTAGMVAREIENLKFNMSVSRDEWLARRSASPKRLDTVSNRPIGITYAHALGEVANNRATAPQTLARMATECADIINETDNVSLRTDPNSPISVQYAVAFSVLKELAGNPNLPAKSQRLIAAMHKDLRKRLLDIPSLAPDVIKSLENDPQPSLIAAAVRLFDYIFAVLRESGIMTTRQFLKDLREMRRDIEKLERP